MKSKKSFKGKLIKLVVENLCKTEFTWISQTTLQEYLDKHLSFKTEVVNFTLNEYQVGKHAEIKFTDEDNKPRVIDVHIAQIQKSVNELVKID
jgi:hypothetical protein